ncbi:hypothetical protein COO60DRAFT_1460879 [Scenedesmus sp. NREL 46B-D3]|nr:hypothetical protein COO60DRAFT_1460879 [Scenedesmus sp. NREL 46B-D3]
MCTAWPLTLGHQLAGCWAMGQAAGPLWQHGALPAGSRGWDSSPKPGALGAAERWLLCAVITSWEATVIQARTPDQLLQAAGSGACTNAGRARVHHLSRCDR